MSCVVGLGVPNPEASRWRDRPRDRRRGRRGRRYEYGYRETETHGGGERGRKGEREGESKTHEKVSRSVWETWTEEEEASGRNMRGQTREERTSVCMYGCVIEERGRRTDRNYWRWCRKLQDYVAGQNET